MTNVQPYREPLAVDVALGEIDAKTGSHFDPDVVAAFLAMQLRDTRPSAPELRETALPDPPERRLTRLGDLPFARKRGTVITGGAAAAPLPTSVDGGFMRLKLVIADDHQLMLEGIRMALADATDIEIVGETSSGSEVLALVRQTSPDVVLLDLRMPGLGRAPLPRVAAAAAPRGEDGRAVGQRGAGR